MDTDGEGGMGAAASSATLSLGRVDAGGAGRTGRTGRTGAITTPLRHLYDLTVGRGDARRRRRRRLRHQMKTTRPHTSASAPRATPAITTT